MAATTELDVLSVTIEKMQETMTPAYLEHEPLHILRISLKPSFRPIHLWIIAEDRRISMQHPSIECQHCPTWETHTIDLRALCWHQASDVQAHSRAETHRFLQACLEVWQGLHFAPLRVFRQLAGRTSFVDLLLQLGVDGLVAEDRPAERLHSRSRGVRTGEAGTICQPHASGLKSRVTLTSHHAPQQKHPPP